MSDSPTSGPAPSQPLPSTQQTPEQIAAEVEAQRAALAETVDRLGDKLDVKSRTRARVSGLRDSATTDDGRPRPQVLAAAGSLVAITAVLVWRLRR